MAAAKTTRNRCYKIKKIEKYHAFTIIESLLVLSVTLIVFSIFMQALFICRTLINKTDTHIENLYKSQFLYWLFYQQITENIGVNHIEPFIITADKNLLDIFIKKRMNLELNNRVMIINKTDKNLSGFKNRLEPSSDIIKIKKYADSNIREQEYIYYIAKKIGQSNHYALYQYSNQRAEELINGISKMKIQKITKYHRDYYLFEFKLDSQVELLSFAIKQSRLM